MAVPALAFYLIIVNPPMTGRGLIFPVAAFTIPKMHSPRNKSPANLNIIDTINPNIGINIKIPVKIAPAIPHPTDAINSSVP